MSKPRTKINKSSSNIVQKVSLSDRSEMPNYIAVEGPIGAGKTSFIQGIAQGLSQSEIIKSIDSFQGLAG